MRGETVGMEGIEHCEDAGELVRRARELHGKKRRLAKRRADAAWQAVRRHRAELVREMEAAVVETMTPG